MSMSPESERLFDKAFKVIKTSTSLHKDTTERYISLVNRRLRNYEDGKLDDIIGQSTSLKAEFGKKFGTFIPRSEQVIGR